MADQLSEEDKTFLAQMEEELKDRYTEKDEEFMKVHNLEPSMPPIMENWYTHNNSYRRNNRRYNPYDRHNNGGRGYQGRGDGSQGRGDGSQGSYSNHRRGYNDYDNRQENRYQRSRY